MKNNEQRKKNPRPATAVGAPLRAMRQRRGLTLDQLSRTAGVSKAMLSQIEQDKVNPTVAVMIKISTALGVHVAELINAPGPSSILQVIRDSDDRYTYRSEAACAIRTLSPLSLEKSIEFYRLTLETGGQLVSEPHFPGTEELLYVEAGRLAVESGDQSATLTKGDASHYRADLPHAIRNVGRGQARAYMVVYYPKQ